MWVSVAVHAGDLVEPVGDDIGHVVVVADPDQRDQVDLAGHGVDLADALEVGDRLGHLGDPRDVGLHEDDGGDHVPTLVGQDEVLHDVGREVEQARTEPARSRRRVETDRLSLTNA